MTALKRQLEELYAGQVDPWDYANDPFEREKYAATLNILPAPRFAMGLEIGCGEGVLTKAAASRFDSLLGVDISEIAVSRARSSCADLRSVEFRQLDFIHDDLDERFDVIVCSEVLYYVPPWRRTRVAAKIARWLAPGGLLVLVHTWREYTRTWDDVYGEGGAERLHRLFTHVVGLQVVDEHATDDYEVLLLRGGSPPPRAWLRRAEAARLGCLAAPPTARKLLRDRLRAAPFRRRALRGRRDDEGAGDD